MTPSSLALVPKVVRKYSPDDGMFDDAIAWHPEIPSPVRSAPALCPASISPAHPARPTSDTEPTRVAARPRTRRSERRDLMRAPMSKRGAEQFTVEGRIARGERHRQPGGADPGGERCLRHPAPRFEESTRPHHEADKPGRWQGAGGGGRLSILERM